MDEAPSMYPNDQTKFRSKRINKIKEYHIAEIRERESISKIFNKYILAFDSFDKTLILLSATSGGICLDSFSSVVGAPVGITSASFGFALSITT